MKITRSQLRRIILKEVGLLQEKEPGVAKSSIPDEPGGEVRFEAKPQPVTLDQLEQSKFIDAIKAHEEEEIKIDDNLPGMKKAGEGTWAEMEALGRTNKDHYVLGIVVNDGTENVSPSPTRAAYEETVRLSRLSPEGAKQPAMMGRKIRFDKDKMITYSFAHKNKK